MVANFFLLAAAVTIGEMELKTPATSRLFEPKTDPISGVTSYLLKQDLTEWNAQSLYFSTPSYSEDGRFLVFNASCDEFKPSKERKYNWKQMMVIDFQKDEIIDLKAKYARGPFLDSKTDSLYYYNHERGKLCRRDLAADPLKDIDVVAVPDEIRPRNSSDYFFSHITLTQDHRKMFCDCKVGSRFFQGMLDFDTGRFDKWSETKFVCNHGQLNPVRDDIAMCAWESAWAKTVFELTDEERKTAKISGILSDVKRPADVPYPRLQLFRKGQEPQMVTSIVNRASHELWTRDGKGFIFCGAGKVIYHDLASGRQHVVCSHGGGHAAITADNRFITFDSAFSGSKRGKPFQVGLCDAEKDQVVWIRPYTGKYSEANEMSRLHPDTHPHFSTDDRWIVWTWLDYHRMRLAVTEVAPLVKQLEPLPKRIPPEPVEWHQAVKDVEKWMKAQPKGVKLTREKMAEGLAIAKRAPSWSRVVTACFDFIYANAEP